jgi:hypothetical protein
MPDGADLLLFALTALRETTADRYGQAADVLFTSNVQPAPDRFLRSNAKRGLENLGHIDEVGKPDGSIVIAALPPTIGVLPAAGLPIAVLCGGRASGTEAIVRKAAAETGVRIRVARQDGAAAPAPARISFETDRMASLARLAEAVGVSLAETPPAWSLMGAAGDIEAYASKLVWESFAEINWPRFDFNPEVPAFRPDHLSGEYRLSRYLDPVRGISRYYLIHDGKSARIDDPDWARWVVLSVSGEPALRYDTQSRRLLVPAGAPLPRPLGRSITLCSGWACSLEGRGGGHSPDHVYRDVPMDIAIALAAKLGQHLVVNAPTSALRRAGRKPR